eukprot:TRINITY_DN4212_c0_g2_i1.p1 TRINITY_DN4212_c0_g2~~TRINITY_DN4212_c0_g2_i1.p1  ORF type:complete len:421 (+),score=65.96 TRINITY_DN4212_c0_g2_i1:207-1469(+)
MKATCHIPRMTRSSIFRTTWKRIPPPACMAVTPSKCTPTSLPPFPFSFLSPSRRLCATYFSTPRSTIALRDLFSGLPVVELPVVPPPEYAERGEPDATPEWTVGTARMYLVDLGQAGRLPNLPCGDMFPAHFLLCSVSRAPLADEMSLDPTMGYYIVPVDPPARTYWQALAVVLAMAAVTLMVIVIFHVFRRFLGPFVSYATFNGFDQYDSLYPQATRDEITALIDRAVIRRGQGLSEVDDEMARRYPELSERAARARLKELKRPAMRPPEEGSDEEKRIAKQMAENRHLGDDRAPSLGQLLKAGRVEGDADDPSFVRYPGQPPLHTAKAAAAREDPHAPTGTLGSVLPPIGRMLPERFDVKPFPTPGYVMRGQTPAQWQTPDGSEWDRSLGPPRPEFQVEVGPLERKSLLGWVREKMMT